MKKVWIAGLLSLLVIVAPATALASVGVGIGTGKITVSQPLKSGRIYRLPTVTVFNTGTQKATYSMGVTLNETQPQLKPKPQWISFSPDNFTLSPGKSVVITPTAHLPLTTRPGKYFAYLEAHPSQTVKQGTTSVGVAAATKLSFTVVASNIFVSLFYRLYDLFRLYEPWTLIVIGLLAAGLVYKISRRFIKVEIKRQ